MEETPGCPSPPSLYKYTVYSSGYGIREGLDYLKLDNTVSTTKDVQSHLRMFGIDGLGAKYGWLRERHELSVTVTKVVKERLEKPTAEVNGLDSSKIFLSALNNDLSIRNAALRTPYYETNHGLETAGTCDQLEDEKRGFEQMANDNSATAKSLLSVLLQSDPTPNALNVTLAENHDEQSPAELLGL
ncbi:hypothetical protein FPRO05_04503 [Fusarium proliferatum]|uniref:Uncharacterized protein n=1 Tax=Gibberella intermedia TaxID=948311 RepID=A0A365MS15_GIBIN|nr:hypothetical protein FPRO05_04503 [Fusarium proliferatum]